MYVIGWRAGAKTIQAITAVQKHTGLSLVESKRLIEDVLAGNSRKLPNDFVLREDLEDCNFIVQ
jgi:ribosomal protein L7/L12